MTGFLRMLLALGALLTVLIVVAAAPSAAQAQPSPADKAQARQLYSEGQQLFRQGHYDSALAAFEKAYGAVPNPVVLLSVAECYVRTERYDQAIATLTRYLAERPDAPDRTQVETQLAALQQKPGVVSVASTPSGAHIFVDDSDSGQTTPADVELPAGDHKLALEAEGRDRTEQLVTVGVGTHQNLSLNMAESTPKPDLTVSNELPNPELSTSMKRGSNLLPVWIATGVAGAGLVTGAILGGVALKDKKSFDDSPTTAKADKGERHALFADVGFGIAAAAGVTAVVLYLTGKKDESEDAKTVSFKPAVGAHRAGLIGKLRF